MIPRTSAGKARHLQTEGHSTARLRILRLHPLLREQSEVIPARWDPTIAVGRSLDRQRRCQVARLVLSDMAEWQDGIDTSTDRGLEIGALHNPRFDRNDPNIFFVDHTDTESLRSKYAEDTDLASHLDDLVDVDFVWGADGRTLAEVTKNESPFDFVYASHVFEHLPNPVGWLEQVADVLEVGGKVSLVIPDKRFCFDVNRQVTEIADLVDAYLSGRAHPSLRSIYDFHSRIVAVDTLGLWSGEVDYSGVWREDKEPDLWAYELCLRSAGGEYVDTHCGVYTAESFLGLVEKLTKLDLIGFRLAEFQPTPLNSLEFKVVLEKLPPDLTAAQRQTAVRDSLVLARAQWGLDDSSQPSSNQLVLGPRELVLIKRKRAAVDRLHTLRARLRGLLMNR